MNEKTAEEKLREELEGNLLGQPKSEERPAAKSVMPPRRAVRVRADSRDKSKAVISDRQGSKSFMDDFESKIEQSLNAEIFKVPQTARPAKRQPVKKSSDEENRTVETDSVSLKPSEKPDLSAQQEEPAVIPEPEVQTEPPAEPEQSAEPESIPEPETQPAPEAQPEPELEAQLEPEILSEPEPQLEPEVLPIPEPEAQTEPQPEGQPAPEELPVSETLPGPEVLLAPEPPAEPEQPAEHERPAEPEEPEELPDIPIIGEDDAFAEQPESEELPDIPVINADEVDEPDELELEEDFADIPVIDAEPEEPEEPEHDISSIDDDKLDEFYEDPDEAVSDELSPPADVVLNVDEDLPQIQQPEPDLDPEAQAAPVSVTMPESTKTAEDKLMADIAEAMTGNPLTLDSPEAQEPYKIPENFFAANPDGDTQSAEDKLIANIAQAMSESPLGAAQDQARQNLEEDLSSPFDEMPLPEAINRFDPEPEPAEDEQEEPEEQEEAFLPDFQEDTESEGEESEGSYILEDTDEELNDPFAIPDFGDDDEEDDAEEQQEQSLLDYPEDTPLAEEEEIPEEPEPEPENTGLTAQDRLAQELASFQQEEPEAEPELEPEPELNTTLGIATEIPDDDIENIDFEEVSQPDNMPEENTLLDESEIGTDLEDDITTEDDDDWDMSSLGELSEAASIHHDEHEELGLEDIPSPARNETEEDHKEKTMGLRDKLESKKNGNSDAPVSNNNKKKSSGGSGFGGMLTTILLLLLLAVGGLIFWQLMTLNERLTAATMGAVNFDMPYPIENINTPQSYDYAIDFILDPNITERMAARGREGWQVVGSRRTQDSTTGQYGYEFIFMRRSR